MLYATLTSASSVSTALLLIVVMVSSHHLHLQHVHAELSDVDTYHSHWGGVELSQASRIYSNSTRGQELVALLHDHVHQHLSRFHSHNLDVSSSEDFSMSSTSAHFTHQRAMFYHDEHAPREDGGYYLGEVIVARAAITRKATSPPASMITFGWEHTLSRAHREHIVEARFTIDRYDLIELTSLTFTPLPAALDDVTRALRVLKQQQHPLSPPPSLCRIICYNIWNFNAPWGRRVRRIGRIVSNFNPFDVIGWQEVRYDSTFRAHGPKSVLYRRQHHVFHLLYVLRGTHMVNALFRPAMTYMHEGRDKVQVEGVATFTKHIVVHRASRLLTKKEGAGDDHQRAVLGVAFLLPPWGIVAVFNTHMSLSLEQQVVNMGEILDFIREFRNHTSIVRHGLPVLEVLLGDMNATPNDAKWMDTVIRKEGFRDAWVEFKKKMNTAPQGGSTNVHGFTFNNLYARLTKRIDFVFLRVATFSSSSSSSSSS
eukprot:PhM_4_TR10351/c0_g1_i1/m.59942